MSAAIHLVNPKYPHNVGSAVRACSCFDAPALTWSGFRVPPTERKLWKGARLPIEERRRSRLPREERMRGFRDVAFAWVPDDTLPSKVTPVAVEVLPSAEQLPAFEHPEDALYVFGPEDGSIPKSVLAQCHRFVTIPTRHCVNLGAAVYLVLYDRLVKRQTLGLEPLLPTSDLMASEKRGWA